MEIKKILYGFGLMFLMISGKIQANTWKKDVCKKGCYQLSSWHRELCLAGCDQVK